jgi:hypothetical protein
MDFPTSEVAPDPSRFTETWLFAPDLNRGTMEAAGKEDQSGLLQLTPTKSGYYVGAVRTAPKLIQLDAAAFNEYLVTDGLLSIYRLRHREKTLDQPGRERYSKSPKFLMRLGAEEAGDPRAVLDLPLEIVPLQNPFRLATPCTLGIRVLFEGKPLADATVGWQRPGDGATPRGSVRTDAKGEALVPITGPGLMTVRLTHMTRPKKEDYEWESFWTSLTFRIP